MNILFLCRSNSAVSPMAEGLARRIGGAQHGYFSAGIDPTALNPLALRAMQEVGIDITQARPQTITAVPLSVMDYVVVLSESIASVGFSSPAQRIFWPQPDPEKIRGTEQERMDAFRKTRDELVPKIRSLFP